MAATKIHDCLSHDHVLLTIPEITGFDHPNGHSTTDQASAFGGVDGYRIINCSHV
jgi:hypothetical protein